MKKKYLLLLLPLATLLLVALSSCSKNDKDDDDPVNSDPFMEVCENVCDVADQIVKYHEASNSIAEMSQYIDDIMQIEYVEDVYTTNTTMFVKIKDYGTISFSYFPEEESYDVPLPSRMINNISPTRASSTSVTEHPQLELENGVVSVWFKGKKEERAKLISKALESCNITTKPKTPTINFFQDEMFDYDVVYINTHGSWDTKQQLHWLITSDKPTEDEMEIYHSDLDKDRLYRYRDIDRNQLSIGFISETHNNTKVSVPYFKVSQLFIQSSEKKFKKKDKAIIFISACQTMMGGAEITEVDQDLKDTGLAEAFEDRDAGAYFGYDESQAYGSIAGVLFFAKLASGMSIQRAYESLPDQLLNIDDDGDVQLTNGTRVFKTWVANLVPYYSKKNSSISNSCITQPVLGEMEDNSTETELKYVLKATSPLFYDSIKDESFFVNGETVSFDISRFVWSIQISEYEDFSVCTNPQKPRVVDYDNNVKTITQSLSNSDLKSGTTYYYRCLFFDGKEFYYSKPDYFKTKTLNYGGSTTIPDVPGSDF